MAYASDSRGYSRRLRDARMPPVQAEVDAEAARDFIMTEPAANADLAAVRAEHGLALLRAGMERRRCG